MSRLSLRRLLSVAVTAALALTVLPASSAFAEARDIEQFACPAGDVPDPGFSDDDVFAEDAIHCIVWYDLAGGTTSSTYSPKALVGRGAMAKFIANLLTAGGVTLPAEPEDAFNDDENSPFEVFINQLAELGVVEGTSDTTYEPGKPVSRAQMASYLARAYEEVTGQALPAGEDAFDDDDGTFHEANINRVAAAGIAEGTGARTYSYETNVQRDHMALFLARLLDILVEDGFVEVPRGDGNNATALDVPELLRAEIASATQVRFVFDEALNSAVSTGAFGLYSFDARRTEATTTSREGTDTVLATFTEEAVSQATLAAVAEGAVQDTSANPSVEGHAALDDVTLAAGTTEAPDLLEVAVAENRATFTFDEAAFSLDDAGYRLVLDDGSEKQSTGVAEGDGTETHTVTFELTQAEAGLVAYGYVNDGTVSDAEGDGNPLNGDEGNLNVLQLADVSASGLTDRPDLVEVIVLNDTQVRYVFDEAVTRVESSDPVRPDPGAFRVYYTDATSASAESSERTSQDTITATFAAGDLDGFISGAIVDAGTVQDGDGDGTNQPQELGFEQGFTAGDTTAPELVSATIETRTNQDETTNRVVRYVFDEDVGEITDGTAFKLYTADGTAEAFEAGATFPPADGSCAVDDQNAKVVECVLADEGDTPPDYLVAAVERGAVEGDGGHSNAEGAAVLKEVTTTA